MINEIINKEGVRYVLETADEYIVVGKRMQCKTLKDAVRRCKGQYIGLHTAQPISRTDQAIELMEADPDCTQYRACKIVGVNVAAVSRERKRLSGMAECPCCGTLVAKEKIKR